MVSMRTAQKREAGKISQLFVCIFVCLFVMGVVLFFSYSTVCFLALLLLMHQASNHEKQCQCH